MKKLILFLVPLFLTNCLFAQDNQSKKEDNQFDLDCTVKSYTSRIKKFDLKITEKGKLYKEISSKKGQVELSLPKGSQFMLEFCAEGHFTKRFAISTEVLDDVKSVPVFDLTINMVEESLPLLMTQDLDLLDFPVAFFAYDSTRKDFYDKNKYYSDIISNGLHESTQQFLKESALLYE